MRTSTLQQMEDHNMDRGAPVLIRIYKEEGTLEVWKENRTGKFTLLQSYPICKFLGQRPVSREKLLREVWGYNSGVTTHTLETHIERLRQKIEQDAAAPTLLLTEASGYKLVP